MFVAVDKVTDTMDSCHSKKKGKNNLNQSLGNHTHVAIFCRSQITKSSWLIN